MAGVGSVLKASRELQSTFAPNPPGNPFAAGRRGTPSTKATGSRSLRRDFRSICPHGACRYRV
jgi:hypothetical protein